MFLSGRCPVCFYSEIKSVIDKQSSELISVTSVVDDFKAATKNVETYADKIIHSTNVKVPETPSWFTVVNGKPRLLESGPSSSAGPVIEPPRRKIVGCSNSSSLKIKSSRVNPASWHVFIGKLEPGTSEQDINDHLAENRITTLNIIKLKAVQKWQEKSAAFKISVTDQFKSDIMKPDLWPDHVELREWIFKHRA